MADLSARFRLLVSRRRVWREDLTLNRLWQLRPHSLSSLYLRRVHFRVGVAFDLGCRKRGLLCECLGMLDISPIQEILVLFCRYVAVNIVTQDLLDFVNVYSCHGSLH
jgi:hypothetical protein